MRRISKEVRKLKTVDELALSIDDASDAGEEQLLRELGEECEQRLLTAEGEERVRLRYFQANTYSGIVAVKRKDPKYAWNWDQPESVQGILALRRAICEPAFEKVHHILACQIRTNLASSLSWLGRPISANELRLKVLETEPRLAKTLAGRAKEVTYLAGAVYDEGHRDCLLSAAQSMYEAALLDNAVWESDDRKCVAPSLSQGLEKISCYLDAVGYDRSLDLSQWPLGLSGEERNYRLWSLQNRLFLNPLNEAYTVSVAATDVLHLPSHVYRIDEAPRFPAYYNLLKQEYISARYRLYHATCEEDPEFLMRDVGLLNSGENQIFGHYTEDLRSAFRSAYSILDKIGLFLNDYYDIGLKPRNVTFRNIWYSKQRSDHREIRPKFRNSRNWLLRGLFFLSKDLFDETFMEVAEPDAADLAKLRNQVEHRFLGFHLYEEGKNDETHRLVPLGEFQDKTLRMLKLAREALIYLSLAMHREEDIREEKSRSSAELRSTFKPRPIDDIKRL
ncbi:MAG: LA2681 family HEPN domain-containing protein [Caldilineaceae bacterium]|nr:LA2681 family HEPN domain-containing protein [Caldilineaceae bacterium]